MSFILPLSDAEVHLLPGLSRDQLESFSAFKTWHMTILHSLFLQSSPQHEFYRNSYKLRSVTIQGVDWFGTEEIQWLGRVKMRVEITNDKNESLTGSVFLRGGSVAMLLILQPDDVAEGNELDKYVIMTVQSRIAAGSLAFAEIPAGMLDDGSGDFSGGAAKVIGEQVRLKINARDLTSITELALPRGDNSSERLQNGVYMSQGGCDEYTPIMPIYLLLRRIPRWELSQFHRKLTGRREEGEKITLKVVRLEDLWREGARDAKALAAFALYRGLKDAGKI